jgi:hypothetical protein
MGVEKEETLPLLRVLRCLATLVVTLRGHVWLMDVTELCKFAFVLRDTVFRVVEWLRQKDKGSATVGQESMR